MDNQSLINSVTAAERMDMQLKGLRPLNPEDIQRYRNGDFPTKKEIAERAIVLMGNRMNLGSGGEREINPQSALQKDDINYGETKGSTNMDLRKSLNESMNEYSNSGNYMGVDDLMSFKKPTVSAVNTGNHQMKGYELAKSYLNAFVQHLENPSSQTRANVYKLLKECLRVEISLNNKPQAQAEYRNGVRQAEIAMYNNLQG